MKKFYLPFFLLSLVFTSSFSQNGKLVIGNNAFMNVNSPAILVVDNNATDAIKRTGNGHIITENENNKVKWIIGGGTGSYTFHLGRSTTDYVPFVFDISSAGVGGAPGSVRVSSWNTPDNADIPDAVTDVFPCGAAAPTEDDVLNRFWVINVDDYVTTNPTADVSFYYNSANDNAGEIADETALQAQRWVDAGGDCDWQAPVGTRISDGSGTYVKVTGVSSFSPWALVNKNKPLPIELLFFDAVLNESVVNVTWATATEINNDYFTLERSADAFVFAPIDTIDAVGNSSSKVDYSRTDHNPLQGVSYYRLKQTDKNGTFTYSNIVSVNFSGMEIIATLPNPAVETITFLINTSEDMDATYAITDIEGRLSIKERVMFSKGVTVLKINISPLSQAIYIIKIVSDDNKYYSSKHFMRTK